MNSALKSNTRLKSRRRHGDPWVSKNRVLNGGATNKAKRNFPIYRNPNFDTDETKLLIRLWGDPKVQRELITTHKKHLVISQLAAKMEKYGYHRSPEEITTRIKNMKCFYNRLKKEMESNPGMDPSWRHYAQMDAIMKRPIFSVRPDEVPAPSLKYLLEQEKEKRKERKRKAEEEGSTISDSDDDIADILAVPSTNANATTEEVANKELADGQSKSEVECETDDCETKDSEQGKKGLNQENSQSESNVDNEVTVKMEIESEEFQEYQCDEETSKKKSAANKKSTAEECIKTINISEDEELLIPKIEPIDVDEEYDKQTTKSKTSALTQNFTQLADILKQPVKTQTITNAVNSQSPAIIKLTLPANSAAATISTSSTTIPTQSKISVVSPTILMPQQVTTSSTDPKPRQVRLPGNLHALLAAAGSCTTVKNANGMKFLLVNAADQRGPPITTSNVATAIPLTGNNKTNSVKTPTNLAIIQNATTQMQQITKKSQQQQQQLQNSQKQQQQLQQQQQQQQQHTNQQQSASLKSKESLKRSEIRQDYKEQLKKRDLLGIKTTLFKMLKIQEDANEIQNKRLAIERERLQFEKALAEKFVTLFEQNQKIQQQLQQLQMQQQQSQMSHIQLQQRAPTSSPATQVFTTNTNQTAVASSGQIMLPPKLLITTMVPTSATAQVANPKIITTNSFTNLNSTANNELQLVVPKEEPQN